MTAFFPPLFPPATLGFVGGGVLGRFLVEAAKAQGYETAVLCPDPDCPAMAIADHAVQGGYDDLEALEKLASFSDLLVPVSESVCHETLHQVDMLVHVRPDFDALHIGTNLFRLYSFFDKSDIGTAPFALVNQTCDLKAHKKRIGYPVSLRPVEKSSKEPGIVLPTARSLRSFLKNSPAQDFIAEAVNPIDIQLETILIRNPGGETVLLPIVQKITAEDGVVFYISPPDAWEESLRAASQRTERIAEKLGLEGACRLSFDVLENGRLLAKDLTVGMTATGLFSLEALRISQFDLMIQAVCGHHLAIAHPLTAAFVTVLFPALPDAEARLERLEEEGAKLLSFHDYQSMEMPYVGAITLTGEDEKALYGQARALWALFKSTE